MFRKAVVGLDLSPAEAAIMECLPNQKQWGNIRKIADAPKGVAHVTFKSREYRI